MVRHKKTSSSPKDILWDKAVEKSGVMKAYLEFTNELYQRYKDGKKGDKLFGEQDYERLGKLAQTERKLYSLYTHRTIKDYGELTNSEKQDINSRIERDVFKQNPFAYLTIEHAKSVVDPGYRSDELTYETTLDNLSDAITAKLKEHKIKGNSQAIGTRTAQTIENILSDNEQILFKTDLGKLDFKEIQNQMSKLPESAPYEAVLAETITLKLLANSRYQKESGGLTKLYDSIPEKFQNRVLGGDKSRTTTLSRSNTENIIIGSTMGLIAAEAAMSLFPSKEKKADPKEQEGKSKKPVQKRLAFRKVISVAATIGLIVTAGLWVNRIAQNGRAGSSQKTPIER